MRRGLFGTRVALVPLRRADYTDEVLRVPFDKVQLRHAPHHDTGRDLSAADEADLYRYYGIDYADESAETVEFRIDAADAPPADQTGRVRLRRHDAGLQERRSLETVADIPTSRRRRPRPVPPGAPWWGRPRRRAS